MSSNTLLRTYNAQLKVWKACLEEEGKPEEDIKDIKEIIAKIEEQIERISSI